MTEPLKSKDKKILATDKDAELFFGVLLGEEPSNIELMKIEAEIEEGIAFETNEDTDLPDLYD
jgi:hypothetical protein